MPRRKPKKSQARKRFIPKVDLRRLRNKQAVRISELEAENRRLREALQHIADPIKYLQQKADAEGTVVNGTQAVAMSKDPEYLKQIARAALSQEDRDGN